LSDLVRLQRGHDLPEPKRRPGSVPVMGSAGLSGYHDEAKVRGPGLVLGRSGASFGKVHYCREDYWPLNTALFATDLLGNEPRFVYYALKAIEFSAFNSGSAQPSLNRNFITSIPTAIPPLVEQRRIVQLLGGLDDKIDGNRRLATLLEDAAATLFRARFVEFVGEAEFVETDLGRVPRGWTVSSIGDVLKVAGGNTPSTKDARYWDGGTHCWATPKDLAETSSRVLLDTKRHITDEGVSRISSGMLPPRTVLLSSRAPVGYTAMSMVPVAVNQGFIAIPPSDRLPAEYVLCWLHENMDRIKAHAGGTTFAEISKRAFRPLGMVVPPATAVAEFEQVARPMFDLLAGTEREVQTLSAVRDALLPKLISGQIRVADSVAGMS
jgi:type I restriction enzyme S subunit